MAYDKTRFDEIKSKTTGELVLFIAMQAVLHQGNEGTFDAEKDSIYDNETIWATEELDKRFPLQVEEKE